MRSFMLPLVVVLGVLLGGCGSNGVGSAAGSASPSRVCAPGSAAMRRAAVVTRADLDGNGRTDVLALTGRRGRCSNTLVAEVGDHSATLHLGRVRLARGVNLVKLPGRPGVLVGARETHPRGGFQLHLYAYADHRLRELVDRNGNPVVPFVATDTGPTPVSAGCGRAGTLVVEEAVAHRSRELAPTWDIRRTEYAVSGAQVTGQKTERIAGGLPAHQLRQRFPELPHTVFFRNCAAAAR